MSSVRSISSTARAGNVLVLLDLYASGFASSTTSPTIPMLTSQTMHALYAISLLIYSLNSLINWVHVFCVLRGQVGSFPLHFWFALFLVVAAISGTMLIILLVMLCVENAFAHRLDITVHKSGLSVILEAFLEWLYGFNNFRVAFLFMLLHDGPLTLANFFLISACRCAGPNVLFWPLLLSSVAMSISLGWRLVILFFAYSRLIFRPPEDSSSVLPSRNPSFRNHFTADLSAASLSDGSKRLDESWPIRWATAAIYGEKGTEGGKREGKAGGRRGTLYLEEGDSGGKQSLGQFCGFWLSWTILKGFDLLCDLCRCLLCILLSLLLYLCCLFVGCLPCLYHYTCRSHSFSHRHKCAKTFVHHCTLFFHYAIFGSSLLFTLLLLFFNISLIFSSHLIGPSHFPPEISRLCISADPDRRIVRPFFLPEPSLFSSDYLLQQRLTQCKPIWDQPHRRSFLQNWAPGLGRLNPGPWQLRFPLPNAGIVLAISTHFISDHSDPKHPRHTLFYDMALLSFGMDNSTKTAECARMSFSGWFFANARNVLDFPYFWACSPTIFVRRGFLIDCEDLAKLGLVEKSERSEFTIK